MKVTLKKYFSEKHEKNIELIGLKVVTLENEEFYIEDFDQTTSEKSLPLSIFLSKKPGSNYGTYKESSSLYVDVEKWEPKK